MEQTESFQLDVEIAKFQRNNEIREKALKNKQIIAESIQLFFKKVYEKLKKIPFNAITIAWRLTKYDVKKDKITPKANFENNKKIAIEFLQKLEVSNDDINAIFPDIFNNGSWSQGSYFIEKLEDKIQNENIGYNKGSVQILESLFELLLKNPEDTESIDKKIVEFAQSNPYKVQMGTITPLIYCLNPKRYAIFNDPVKTVLNFIFKEDTQSTDYDQLLNYPQLNIKLRRFREQYGFKPDFADLDTFFFQIKDLIGENQPERIKYWFILYRPDFYNLFEVANKKSSDNWELIGKNSTQKGYMQNANVGDRVLFWQAVKDQGIVAEGTISKSLHLEKSENIYEKYHLNPDLNPSKELEVIEIQFDRIYNEKERRRLRKETLISRLDYKPEYLGTIITMKVGTFHKMSVDGWNFFQKITQEEDERDNKLIFLENLIKTGSITLDQTSKNLCNECITILKQKKQIILYGPPGTGKTFLAQAIANEITKLEKEQSILIQFHPEYTYENFIECIRLKPGLNMELEPRAQIFREFCQKAIDAQYENVYEQFDNWNSKQLLSNQKTFEIWLESEKSNFEENIPKFVIIIDEINRGDLSRIFGETIFGLEYRNTPISTMYFGEKNKLIIPENLYLIGTMNSVDRSIAIVDYALRRRFFFYEITPNRQVLENWLIKYNPKLKENVLFLYDKLNGEKSGWISQNWQASPHLARNFLIGQTYFFVKNLDQLKQNWKYAIIPLLFEYMNYSKE